MGGKSHPPKKSAPGVDKGGKSNSMKKTKSNKRESESDVFFELENKKESAEDGKRRAIQISLLNWNKLVLTQLLVQEKENALRKELLERASSSSSLLLASKDMKGLSGQLNSTRNMLLSTYDKYDRSNGSENEGDRERRKDAYFAHHPKGPSPVADYPPLLYVRYPALVYLQYPALLYVRYPALQYVQYSTRSSMHHVIPACLLLTLFIHLTIHSNIYVSMHQLLP